MGNQVKHRHLDLRDGGYFSRKLVYSVFTSISIMGCGFLAGYWAGFKPNLETVIGGLLGALGLYLGGNLGNKWMVAKAPAAVQTTPPVLPANQPPPEPLPEGEGDNL